MLPYLVTFALSILFCCAGERMLAKSRIAGFLLCALSVFFPVLLAAARDYEVGTDVATYGNYVFQGAYNSDKLTVFLNTRKDIETLYKALAYAVSRFTNNPHWFYFVTALIICGFTMYGLGHFRNWCSMTLSWACFLFLFYGDTLNIMRQCLALAVAFAAFSLFTEGKYIRFAVLSVISVMFHVTGVIALALPVIYLVMRKFPPRWLQFFLIFVFLGMILFYSPLLQIVLQMNILPAKFARYMANGVALALNPTLLRLPFLLPIILYYDRFCGFREVPDNTAVPVFRGDGESPADEEDGAFCGGEASRERTKSQVLGMFIVIMLLLEICTVQLRSVRPALYRISYYFGYYKFLAYSRIVGILRRDNRIFLGIVLIAYLAVVWYYQNAIQGNNEIYPYIYTPHWYDRMIPVVIE